SPSMLSSTRPRSAASSSATSSTSRRVMCRSSARGWTVMPGAPASMVTRNASTTDGRRPPRELRSVATLLTLTDSRVMASGKVRADRQRDFLRPGLDLVVLLALDHDAQERLGPRIANEQAALAVERRLDPAD